MNYWAPHVTVAAIIEREGRFLVVEERSGGQIVFNQPAGHLEPDESLLDAVVRETREETGHLFEPQGLVGVYQYRSPKSGEAFLRFAFCGAARAIEPRPPLDDEILATHWLTPAELAARQPQLRSSMVLEGIRDYQAGPPAPLALLRGGRSRA